jgi:phosphatidylglycerol---prolipoprotein diacylglyceryl transferase
MYPTLFQLGPVIVRTSSLFSLLAFLATAFIFWKKTKEEHYHQDQAFDAFLLASIAGLVVGRVGFMLLHLGELGRNLWNWFDVVGHPGSSVLFGLLGASYYLYRYAKKQKWDQLEVLDFWFLSITVGMVFIQLGTFFAGTGFGFETQLPWGMVFPGVFAKHHPVQLYSALFYLILYIYLYWAEYNYRTFIWYKAGKKTAQTGFLTCVFLMATSGFMLLMQLVKPAQYMINQINIDVIIYGVMFVGSSVMLYLKSGRSINLRNKKN